MSCMFRSHNDLEQFKPAQPEQKFEFPQVPLLQKPLEHVVGWLQKEEPDRNIIPPPLHIQLKKPTLNPTAPGLLLTILCCSLSPIYLFWLQRALIVSY